MNFLVIYLASFYSKPELNNNNTNNNAEQQTISNLVRSIRSRQRKVQLTRMILLLTFLYVIISLPDFILYGYYYSSLYKLYYGQMIVNILNAVHFSYPAFQIFILYYSNNRFAREFKKIVKTVNHSRNFTNYH